MANVYYFGLYQEKILVLPLFNKAEMKISKQMQSINSSKKPNTIRLKQIQKTCLKKLELSSNKLELDWDED